MMSVLKALKRQAGKPFRVIDDIPLVEGFDHYSYKTEPDVVQDVEQHVAHDDQHIDTQEVLEESASTPVGMELECITEQCQMVSESLQQQEDVKKEETVQAAVELAQNVKDYIDSKVDTLVAAIAGMQPAPIVVPPPTVIQTNPKPVLRKVRTKVISRDRDGMIDTIESQDY